MTKFLLAVVFVVLKIISINAKLETLQQDKLSEIVKVFHEINENVFAKETSFVRIISSETFKFSKELSQLHEKSVTIELIQSSKLNNSTLMPSLVNVICVESSNEFKEIVEKFSFNFSGFFLIILIDCDLKIENEIFATSWRRYMHNVNILCSEKNKSISIKTFMPFQEHSCQNTSSIKLKCDQGVSLGNIYPEKLNNIYDCPIKLATFFYPPITMRDSLDNGSSRYYGSEMELIFALSNALNFSIDMTYIPHSGFTGLLYENGTATGIMKETIEGEKDMLLGFYYLTYLRTQHMSFTQSHYSIPLVIMIPSGESLTPFEKLFRPFENTVWIFLFITLATGIVVVFIFGFMSQTSKDFIFGDRVRNPYLNMLIAIVGGSQHILPKRNFARSLLMMFLLFCLVQRSIYQGSLYIFLQSDGTKPDVATIDEMMEKNFVFYVRETLEHNIKHMSFYQRRKVVKFADYPELTMKTLDSTFKGGVIQPLLEVIFLNQQNYQNFTFHVLKEYLLDVQIVIYFPRNFYLVEPMNDKIGIYKAAGLVNLWMERYIDKSYLKIKPQTTKARTMNIKQLFGGFQILLIGALTASFVFAIELMSKFQRFEKFRKILKSTKL